MSEAYMKRVSPTLHVETVFVTCEAGRRLTRPGIGFLSIGFGDPSVARDFYGCARALEKEKCFCYQDLKLLNIFTPRGLLGTER